MQHVNTHDDLVDKARQIAAKSSRLVLEERNNCWRLDLVEERRSLASLAIIGTETEFSLWAPYPDAIPENLREVIREMALFKYDAEGPNLSEGPNLIRRTFNLVDVHPEYLVISSMLPAREMIAVELHAAGIVEAVLEVWDVDGRYTLNGVSKPLADKADEAYRALLDFASQCLLQAHTPRSLAYGSTIRPTTTIPPPSIGAAVAEFD